MAKQSKARREVQRYRESRQSRVDAMEPQKEEHVAPMSHSLVAVYRLIETG